MVESETTLTLEQNEPNRITFTCDELVIEENKVNTVWKDGCPLDMNTVDVLEFEIRGKKFIFEKI